MVRASQRTEDELNPYVFLMTRLNSKGMTFTLAPLDLGSLYARLDECIGNITRTMGRYHVVTHAESIFLFLSGEVPINRPKTHRVSYGGQGGGDGDGLLKQDKGIRHIQASGMEVLLDTKVLTSRSLANVLHKEENFCSRPYSYTPWGCLNPRCRVGQ